VAQKGKPLTYRRSSYADEQLTCASRSEASAVGIDLAAGDYPWSVATIMPASTLVHRSVASGTW